LQKDAGGRTPKLKKARI